MTWKCSSAIRSSKSCLARSRSKGVAREVIWFQRRIIMSNPVEKNSADFIVRLDGLHLDEAARNRIAGAVQSAVMAELGNLDLTAGQPKPGLAYIPLKWRGIWLRHSLPEGLGDFGRELGVT